MTNTIRISLIYVDKSIHTFITGLWKQLQNIYLPASLWLHSGRIWQTYSQSRHYLIAEIHSVSSMCRSYYTSILSLNCVGTQLCVWCVLCHLLNFDSITQLVTIYYLLNYDSLTVTIFTELWQDKPVSNNPM